MPLFRSHSTDGDQASKPTGPKISAEVVQQVSSLRAADTKDVKRMAEVIIAAMELSPHWKWRYPYRKQFPDVHQRETEKAMASYVKKSKDGICVTLVAEVETEVDVEIEPEDLTTEELLMGMPKRKKKQERRKVKEIVGVAIAQYPGTFVEPMTRILKAPSSSSSPVSSDSSTIPITPITPITPHSASSIALPDLPKPSPLERADSHPGRSQAFYAEFGPAKKRYFDFPYGNEQLYIDFMAVHPDFHRRGIAKRLLDWMLELAKKEKDAKVVTLFSSPMGEHLYKKAGFEEVGSVSVKLDGDTGEGAEGIVAPVLVWSREKHVRAELV